MATGTLASVMANQDPTGRNTFNGDIQIQRVDGTEPGGVKEGDICPFFSQEVAGGHPEKGAEVSCSIGKDKDGSLFAENIELVVKTGGGDPTKPPIEDKPTEDGGDKPIEVGGTGVETPPERPEPTPAPAPSRDAEPSRSAEAAGSAASAASGGEGKKGGLGCMALLLAIGGSGIIGLIVFLLM